ncbi:MAG: 6-carboxytetrahydropterin synthase [bacterium JZ-2024 1]
MFSVFTPTLSLYATDPLLYRILLIAQVKLSRSAHKVTDVHLQMTIVDGFSAAHRYWVKEWSVEQNRAVFGKCAREGGHGHNYEVRATFELRENRSIDEARTRLHAVLEQVDHKNLNLDTSLFIHRQPTTENICVVIFSMLRDTLPDFATLIRVCVLESEDLWATTEGKPEVSVGRRVSFSASHRLWSSALSESENARIFGKCANANGHGHNYTLEIEVCGIPDPVTGFVVPLTLLDEAIRQVITEWDHARLDTETPDFVALNPTGENISLVAWRNLQRSLSAPRISYLRLWETPKIYFEVFPLRNAFHG